VRRLFHPSLGGPGPASPQPTDIFVSDIRVAIRSLAGVRDPVAVKVACTPSDVLKTDENRGLFIHVGAGKVVDWRVAIQLG
jgi:hypothetical protein